MKTFISFLMILLLIFFTTVLFSQQKSDRPVAVNDSVTMMQYGTVEINVLANDYDPNGLAIFIEEVDEEDGFEVSFQDSIVSITALEYYDYSYARFDYCIENESGEADCADILVYFEENPEVPVPVMDFIEMNTQSELIVNLVENDSSNSDKNISIYDVRSSNLSVEILDDQQSVKIMSNENPVISSFSYRIVEENGNGLVSKWCSNRVNVYRNPDQPIVVIDSFMISENETALLNVLQNDISLGDLVLVPDTNYNIVNNQIEYTTDSGVFNSFRFISYKCKDESSSLVSQQQWAVVYIESNPERPTAVNDTLWYPYADTIYVNPLINDINPLGNALVIEGSMDTTIKFFIQAFTGDGWKSAKYVALDSVSGLKSTETARTKVRIIPPEYIEIEDITMSIKIGETLELDVSEYTNLHDSLIYGVESKYGYAEIYGSQLTYSLNLSNQFANYLFYESKGNPTDTIVVYYHSPKPEIYPQKSRQYIYVNFEEENLINYLDIGKYSIKVNPFGVDINNDLGSASIDFPLMMKSHYFNSSSNISTMGAIHPWLANYSESLGLKVAGEQYNNIGEDFYPGPLTDNYNSDYTNKYFRTWKLNRYEIDEHRASYQEPGYEINETILNWPAGKITYNEKEYDQADFQDVNGNGLYEPLEGEYPIIYGDQAVLYIVNDGRFTNWSENNYYTCDTLNLDVFVMLYGFNRPGYDIMMNTFFVKYKVVNKADVDYENFKFGIWSHFDPSCELYTAIGCDSTLDTYYSYPKVSNYIEDQLLHSVTFLNRKMNKFTNTIVAIASPWLLYDVKYQFMSGTWNDTTLFKAPYWVDKTPLNYVYPSHPANPYGWSMQTEFGKGKGVCGRQGLGTSDNHMLSQGKTLEFEFAFHYNIKNLGYIENIDQILEDAKDLKECYQKDSVPGGGSFTGIKEVSNDSNIEILVYPNPARTLLYVDGATGATEYSIYTLQGQRIGEGRFENEISIEHLKEGFYLLQIKNTKNKQVWTTKFIKH